MKRHKEKIYVNNLCQQLLDMAIDKKESAIFRNKKDCDFIFSNRKILKMYPIGTYCNNKYWGIGNATSIIFVLEKLVPQPPEQTKQPI